MTIFHFTQLEHELFYGYLNASMLFLLNVIIVSVNGKSLVMDNQGVKPSKPHGQIWAEIEMGGKRD